jgi:hypothetical protein
MTKRASLAGTSHLHRKALVASLRQGIPGDAFAKLHPAILLIHFTLEGRFKAFQGHLLLAVVPYHQRKVFGRVSSLSVQSFYHFWT